MKFAVLVVIPFLLFSHSLGSRRLYEKGEEGLEEGGKCEHGTCPAGCGSCDASCMCTNLENVVTDLGNVVAGLADSNEDGAFIAEETSLYVGRAKFGFNKSLDKHLYN